MIHYVTDAASIDGMDCNQGGIIVVPSGQPNK
jgi:hypothetical protein